VWLIGLCTKVSVEYTHVNIKTLNPAFEKILLRVYIRNRAFK
jgi:hypothetical protein